MSSENNSNNTNTKTLNLTSLVTKKTRRAKERLLQNFGKADKTTDELFEVYQLNFQRQQTTALNLQKHVKHYLNCLKELHDASRSLSRCLFEMHEGDWPKHEIYENNVFELEHIQEDLEEKIKESVLVPLEQYMGQFSEMREKIGKRGRKLVDYDSQRHKYEESQQRLAGKQQQQQQQQQLQHIDDTKLSKSRDQLDEARKVYETLNNELHDELPALYDNRLPLIITIFQRLFSSRITYHQDNLAVEKSYLDTVELLAKASDKGLYNSSTTKPISYYETQSSTHVKSDTKGDYKKESSINTANNNNKQIPNESTSATNKNNSDRAISKVGLTEVGTTDIQTNSANIGQKPPVYLHKVRAAYKYIAEDEDEISFEAGEIIQVIEYDDPSEQEEGWLIGIKESNGQRGLFPANFTKQIEES